MKEEIEWLRKYNFVSHVTPLCGYSMWGNWLASSKIIDNKKYCKTGKTADEAILNLKNYLIEEGVYDNVYEHAIIKE